MKYTIKYYLVCIVIILATLQSNPKLLTADLQHVCVLTDGWEKRQCNTKFCTNMDRIASVIITFWYEVVYCMTVVTS